MITVNANNPIGPKKLHFINFFLLAFETGSVSEREINTSTIPTIMPGIINIVSIEISKRTMMLNISIFLK